MVTVELYDSGLHGHVDDCDYVITFNDDLGMYLAEQIAERLSVSDYKRYDNQFFCCHA